MTTITQENIKFNGTLDNAAVLDEVLTAGGLVRTVIAVDDLSGAARAQLDAFVTKYGTNPLAAATAGTLTANFPASTIGTTPTGLNATATATSGSLIVDVGGNKTAELASGLSPTRAYAAVFTIDGYKQRSVRFSGADGTVLEDVVSEMNADLAPDATASIEGGNLVVTSTGTGPTSTVTAQDTGSLFASLTGYTKISSTTGSSPRVYSMFAEIDGVTIPVSFQGSTAQTFTDLVTEINIDLDTAGTAALVSGDIVITSATTGTTSKVTVVQDDLLKHVSGFAGTASVSGATNLIDAMKMERFGSGSLFDLFNVNVVGEKPARPPVPLVIPKIPEFTYFGGSPAAWRYLEDDTVVNP